jgi:hypothetical protein
MIEQRTCPACELTMAQACAGGAPPVLCGLCKLVPASQLIQYFERWNQRIAELRAEEAA